MLFETFLLFFPAEEAEDKAWGSVAKLAPIALVLATELLAPRSLRQDAVEGLTSKCGVTVG